MKKAHLFLLLFLLSVSHSLRAQSAPAIQITLGQSVVALTGPWKFHIGDNPQWASPNFDDSQWEMINLPPNQDTPSDPAGFYAKDVPGWTAKGHPGYWGYAWYRIQVRVAAQSEEKLALAGPAQVDDAYQAFANGALLGSSGKFSGHEKNPSVYITPGSKMFLLPQPETQGGGVVPIPYTLAFRVWMGPTAQAFGPDRGGLRSPPFLGVASAAAARVESVRQEWIRIFALQPIEAALFFLLAIIACSLVLFDRSDPVYFWLAAVLFVTALDRANQAIYHWTLLESHFTAHLIQTVLLGTLVLAGWVMVWWVWFRLRHPAWMPKAIAGLTLLFMVCQALEADYFFTIVPHRVSAAFHVGSLTVNLIFGLLLILIAVLGIWQQGHEGWLALPAVALFGIGRFLGDVRLFRTHTIWYPFGIEVTLADINYVALAGVIFALLLRRLLLSIRQQRETALDIKQAKEVQRVLIPEDLPLVPGLAIESEYRPAREVGGDFFQIVPHAADGSVLIVVGDVTGKGLQAGMLVALIVGTIRTAVEKSFEPLDVLQTLNRRLCGRGHAHATCLAVRIAADGSATLANAGHLPPYLNGNELPMEGALPLGMVSNAEFSLMRFHFAPHDCLMLLSDGVAEAQDEHGHLFGFERIQAMLQKSVKAAEIAAAAQTFGQQDDISVLSVTRTANLKTALAI